MTNALIIIYTRFLWITICISFSLSFSVEIGQTPKLIAGVQVHQVKLRSNDPWSPWCYAVTVDPTIAPTSPDMSSYSSLSFSSSNFLATQVWPSARVASQIIERNPFLPNYQQSIGTAPNHDTKIFTVCEFGCGPALPSITLARSWGSNVQVLATDVDEFALELVRTAAQDQGLSNLSTQRFDLLWESGVTPMRQKTNHSIIPKADLYIMSDIFESSHVARGAARVTFTILEQTDASIWVFVQSDRVQRDCFLKELNQLLENHSSTFISKEGRQKWTELSSFHPLDSNQKLRRLSLCEFDEIHAYYG